MPYRLTKIYTRKGDEGFTTLHDERIPKDDFLVEAIGTLDELNSAIGLVLSFRVKNKKLESQLRQIQNDLFDFGGELHAPAHPVITAGHVTRLENELDELNATLEPLEEFILPGGSPQSAAMHLARTICRRAERVLVRLHRQVPLSNMELLRYLNRLSDLLFVTARVLSQETQEEELMWDHERERK